MCELLIVSDEGFLLYWLKINIIMKYLLTSILVVCFSIASSMAQTKSSKSSNSKQYRSAETGRYVTKTTATKNPSTTYSTTRKSKK